MRRATRSTCWGGWSTNNIAKASALGVTGISYGGGQSIELAYLKNRIRLPNGSFAPWFSPNGVPLAITAAYPRWPWSDLVDALLPNGRFLDTQIAPPGQSREPIGVEIQSYVSGLYALGNASGYIAPAGADPEADLTKWFGLINAGEPYTFEAESDRQPDLHLPPGLRPVRNARADVAGERLDR